ncbi:MAG TPA: glycosyltransferase family 4 protein, partial [Rhodocyclaceae bacterium]|nr:glycosyltransferase family 4 protein [Rhodocyclaceae bacterium]
EKHIMKTTDLKRRSSDRFIYIACPWTHLGGGMFKVADYLIQSQTPSAPDGYARLVPLDTRGGGSALFSFWVLFTALCKLVAGRISGKLAGVHVNMAERLSIFRKGTIVAASRLLGIPVILHLHAAQLHHFYRGLPSPLQAATRWIFSQATHCLVLGNASREFVTHELQVPASKIEIVTNGVPAPSLPRRLYNANEPKRILFLGNLSERKGVSDLLHAVATPGFGHNLTVSLAGSGDIPTYQALAEKLGVSSFVRFEGWADQAKAAQLIAAADVLVLPSYDEGLPLVILEALANSVAVVCTPVGEIGSTLSDGLNAHFVTPGDIPGIAAGLHKTLYDEQFRATLESNGRQIYEARFSMTRFFDSIAAIHKNTFGISAAPGFDQADAGKAK